MNPYINVDGPEIDLPDLVRFLFRKICWILLAGVLCALLAGCYKYYSVRSTASAPPAEAGTESSLELEKYIRQSELLDTSDESTSEVMKRQQDYLRNSLYMQIDPNHVWKAQTVIRVSSSDPDFPVDQLDELYQSDITDTGFLEELAKAQGTEAVYLGELVSILPAEMFVETGAAASDIILREEVFDSKAASKLFCVQTIGHSAEEATVLMDAVVETLETAQKEYKQTYPHEFQILSRHCSERADSDMLAAQKNREAVTQDLMFQMKDNQDKGNLLEKPVEGAGTASGRVSKKKLLKYVLVGFAVGVFLMCCWYTFRYLRNDKLVDYQDIERKGLFLKNLGSVSDQYGVMAAANIRSFAGNRKKLFLTGMAEQGMFDQACEALKEHLSDYEIVSARDVLHDPKTKEVFMNCDAAVLVEQKGLTRYSDMKEEVTFLFHAGREIIGIVII